MYRANSGAKGKTQSDLMVDGGWLQYFPALLQHLHVESAEMSAAH